MAEAGVVLVVDDEKAMQDIVAFALQTQGFDTVLADDAESAWAILTQQQVDLVVLDVMLPGMSGVELTRRIRQTGDLPVILLTALGDTSERIAGLEAGATDYVSKPFHPRELALRAAALARLSATRRPAHREPGELRSGALVLNLATNTATVRGRRVELTLHEYRLLSTFLSHPFEPVSFRTLTGQVWGDEDLFAAREQLKTAVYRLRLKLSAAEPSLGESLQSVRGVGYVYRPRGDPVTEP